MLQEISRYLKNHLSAFPAEDQLIFNNKVIPLNSSHFTEIRGSPHQAMAFVDGGQAEILSAGNFCLSFIRVGVLVYSNNLKIKEHKHEFYLLTTAKYESSEVMYESTIFPLGNEALLDEHDLQISSTDATIRSGAERAPISRVSNLARRFAELALCRKVDADIIVLDGTLEPSFKNEEKYLSQLPSNVCALAKSSSLFTASGNSPVVLLNKLGPEGCWSYLIEGNNYFVKLHPKAKHVFRFTGEKEFISLLVKNSTDALFLGYPYGLIAVDGFARVSNEEKKNMRMNILLKAENRDLLEYLSTTNAHDILDNLG